MGFSLLNILIITHFVIAAVYTVLIFTRRSTLTHANILPILCVPFFGVLSALAADLVNITNQYKEDPDPIETFSLSEDIYWKSIKKREEAKNIVPLEEALIINDRQTRKKLILEMLLDDPMKNINILLLARENNDVDTAHYANTTIAKIQRNFQLQVQQLSVEHEADPDNSRILNNYIEILGNFIESGLSEAFLLKRQRVAFADLLEKKISLDGWNKKILLKKIHNCLAIKDLNTAIEANEILKKNFPDDEQTWINALRISVADHDAVHLEKTIGEINHRKISWSSSGKEQVSTWVQV